jgi:hypothetical protein
MKYALAWAFGALTAAAWFLSFQNGNALGGICLALALILTCLSFFIGLLVYIFGGSNS